MISDLKFWQNVVMMTQVSMLGQDFENLKS